MENTINFIIGLTGLILAWHLFYNVIKARTTRRLVLKTAIVVLLFSSLILRLSHDAYAFSSRLFFSLNKQGEVELINSPFKIPVNGNKSYCNQFTDQNGQKINAVSTRKDGSYCGQFWRFNQEKALFIPFKSLNEKQTIYWASPNLQIIGSK